MKLLPSILILAASIISAHSPGEKCPENIRHLKDFDNGAYLLEEDELTLIECQTPTKADSLLNIIGISKEIMDRISGVRHSRFDNSNYSKNDLQNIFNTKFEMCNQRTDGLFECHSKDYRYSSISTSKNSFPYISNDLPGFNISYEFDTKDLWQPILYPLGKGFTSSYYINDEWQNPVLPAFITRARLSKIGIGSAEIFRAEKNVQPQFSRLNDYLRIKSLLQNYTTDSVGKFIAIHSSEYVGGRDTLDSLFVKQTINNLMKDSAAIYHSLIEMDTVMKFATGIILDSICRENLATKGKTLMAQNGTLFCDGDYERGLIGYYSNLNLSAFIDSQIYVPVYALYRDGKNAGSLHRINAFINRDGSIFVSVNQGIVRWSYNDNDNNLWIGDGAIWNKAAAIYSGTEKSINKDAPVLDIIKYWFAPYDRKADYRYASLNSINVSTHGMLGPSNYYSIHDRNLFSKIFSGYRYEVERLYPRQTKSKDKNQQGKKPRNNSSSKAKTVQ